MATTVPTNSNNKRFIGPNHFNTELVLYYHPHSFYSQKVKYLSKKVYIYKCITKKNPK